ncbi:MAG: hypothetical protein ACJ72L_04590 [Marmoricola sp.]
MSNRTPRSRSEHGAIAIMVGLLATLMFSSAAICVDLGSAWARKRDVQKQVDVSALSVGWMLPMTVSNKSDIATKVAAYFADQLNKVPGQSAVTGQQLVNGSNIDGELWFQNVDGSPCSDNCPQMQVYAPPSKVDFGLASVIGVTSTKVQRTATVRITSELPPGEDTLPFWLPTGCGYGPTEADTTQGGTNLTGTPMATPTGTPTSTPSASRFVPTPVGVHQLNGTAVTPVTNLGSVTINGWWVTGVGNSFKKVTLRAFPPTGSAFVDFAAQTNGNGSVPSFNVSTEISSIPGDWYVYAVAEKNNSLEYSSDYLTIRVTPPVVAPTPTPTPTTDPTDSAVAVGCIGQDRGNFGQLDAPRLEGGTKQARLAKNIAMGMDHQLVPYVFAPGTQEQKDCGSGGSLLPGAQLDDTSRDGNNCITGDTGNDGPKMMDGLVQGISGVAVGRLDIANGQTTCPGRSNLTISGKLLNNDVLSCFLRDGATLTDITSSTGVTTAMLDQSIIKSPRFVWLPVVYATDRAQKNFQPIREFVPGFITDESQTTAATSANGLEINGNSVSVLHVFTFNRDAIAPRENSTSVTYSPDVGGGIVRLVG